MLCLWKSLPLAADTFSITTTEAMGPRLRGDDIKRLLPILLDAGGAEAGEAVLVDGELPGQEFVDRQRIATAGFFQRQQPAAHGGEDVRLAADHPPLGAGCGQVRDR